MSNPFSKNYIQPIKIQNYLRFNEEGSYLFRIITPKESVVSYYKGFIDNPEEGQAKVWTAPDNQDGKMPIVPDNINLRKWDKKDSGYKLYWAFVVYNLDTQNIQIWDISQKVFRDYLFSIASGKIKNDWTKFDIQVTKTGQKTDTTYNIINNDNQELTKEAQKIIKESYVNLEAMEKGGDPFDEDTFIEEGYDQSDAIEIS